MNENNPDQPAQEPGANPGGFEDESAAAGEQRKRAKGQKPDRMAVLKANFNSVFGHGIGKAGLIIAGLFVLIAGAFAFRGLNGSKAPQVVSAQVDVPQAPVPEINVDPIDVKEAERRSQLSAMEAEVASKKGQTYQPGFNPVLEQSGPANGQAQLNIPGQASAPPPVVQPVQVALPAESAQQVQQAQQEEQRRQAELDKQRSERDKYIAAVRGGVTEQAGEMLQGKGKDGGFGGRGVYSTVSYLPSAKPSTPLGAGAPGGAAVTGGTAGTAASAGAAPAALASDEAGAGTKKKILFKAGSTAFATLDSEVNTDDGGEVFATMHGGKFNGAKLIGKIESAPRNIRLRFSMLAPQDERPTVAINAIAIREEDAKQGVAETIDNHTLSRYTALLAGSLLSGLGRAAAEPQGDTLVLPNGQVVVSQQELTNKRIAMFALGEIGTNAGTEVRKNFSQPPTYVTPANKGIGLIFLADVAEKQ